jgi:hypothetical protein
VEAEHPAFSLRCNGPYAIPLESRVSSTFIERMIEPLSRPPNVSLHPWHPT